MFYVSTTSTVRTAKSRSIARHAKTRHHALGGPNQHCAVDAPMSTTDQSPKPKLHWLRYKLKTLLLVMLLFTVTVGCAVGWIRYRQGQARENRARVAAVDDAVAAIEKLGGKVTKTYERLRRQTWLEKQFDDPGDADNPVGVYEIQSFKIGQLL